MKRFFLVCAALACAATLPDSASAQPILNRVEKLLRDQLGAEAPPQTSLEPGYLGMVGDDTQDAGKGVRVLEVYPDQPAAHADLQQGDLITKIDGRQIRNMDDMAAALADKPSGVRIIMSVERGGIAKSLNVTLGRRPAPAGDAASPAAQPLPVPPPVAESPFTPDGPRIGVRAMPVTEEVRRQHNLPAAAGAHIVSIGVGSPAEQAQLPLGAVVTAVDDVAVRTPQELARAIQSSTQPDVTLTYSYQGQTAKRKVALRPTLAADPGPQLETRAAARRGCAAGVSLRPTSGRRHHLRAARASARSSRPAARGANRIARSGDRRREGSRQAAVEAC